MYFVFSASSHAAARASTIFWQADPACNDWRDLLASFSSSCLLAQAAMLVFPNCVPRTIISLLVFICISFSLNPSLLLSCFALRFRFGFGSAPVSDLLGLVGLEGLGLAGRIGVPVLEGSWLAIGVISVPMSRMETDLTVEGGTSAVAVWRETEGSWRLRLTALFY